MEKQDATKKIKRGRTVNYNGFEEAYENLPHRHRMTVRRELQKRLRWSPTSFYYKRSGESPLRENEIPVIQEIFKRFGISAWTGEKI